MIEKTFGHEVQSFRDVNDSDWVQVNRSDLPNQVQERSNGKDFQIRLEENQRFPSMDMNNRS